MSNINEIYSKFNELRLYLINKRILRLEKEKKDLTEKLDAPPHFLAKIGRCKCDDCDGKFLEKRYNYVERKLNKEYIKKQKIEKLIGESQHIFKIK